MKATKFTHNSGFIRCLSQRQRRLRAKRKLSMKPVSCGILEKRDMHHLSAAVGQLTPSKTVALTDLAKSMIEDGHDVISLSAGEPDFPTPVPVAEAAVEAIRSGFTKYTQSTGIQALRSAICEKLKCDNGLEYSDDCIVVSNGAKQAAWQAVVSMCGEGDELLIPAPYWVSYPEMAVLAGAIPKIIECPLSDGFILKPAALENAVTERSRLLILCTPSNPTGAMYTRQQLEDIADIVRRHPRLLVLADEIYEYMSYPPAQHVSFASLPGMHERTLTINGFSKGFAMTGWRLGYLAAPARYAKACATVQSHCTSAPCSISQKAGLAALEMVRKEGPIITNMVQTYQSRRDYVLNRLRSISGVLTQQPDGAFYVFPDVSALVGNGAHVVGFGSIDSTEQLCTYLIHKALVTVVPGEAFGAPGHIRVSYATSMPLLEQALDRIEQALSQIQR